MDTIQEVQKPAMSWNTATVSTKNGFLFWSVTDLRMCVL